MGVCNIMSTFKNLAKNPFKKLKTMKKKVQKTSVYKNFVMLSKGGRTRRRARRS